MSENKRVVKKVGVTVPPSSGGAKANNLVFNKQNYIYMGIGVALIFLGMLLMSGGHMPSGDVWDESLIYGARRIIVAPILILAGLVIEIYAIFKK